jgi:hypothetical protein
MGHADQILRLAPRQSNDNLDNLDDNRDNDRNADPG